VPLEVGCCCCCESTSAERRSRPSERKSEETDIGYERENETKGEREDNAAERKRERESERGKRDGGRYVCNRLIYANCKCDPASVLRARSSPRDVAIPGASGKLRSNKATNQPNERHADAGNAGLMRHAPYVALTMALMAFLYVYAVSVSRRDAPRMIPLISISKVHLVRHTSLIYAKTRQCN